MQMSQIHNVLMPASCIIRVCLQHTTLYWTLLLCDQDITDLDTVVEPVQCHCFENAVFAPISRVSEASFQNEHLNLA